MDLEVSDKHALVLGGGRGLGAAIADCLASEGGSITTVSRTAMPNSRHHHIVADLDHAGAAKRILTELTETERETDILVLNSGGPPTGSAKATQPSEYAAVFPRMLGTQIELAQALLPRMQARKFGRIIAIASTSVIAPIPGLVLSNSIRAALATWCKTLAGEVAADGITVNLLLPGRIETDRLRSLHEARALKSDMTPDEIADAQRSDIPMGRFGIPREFADVAAFIASPRASYITGSAIKVDGGLVPTL